MQDKLLAAGVGTENIQEATEVGKQWVAAGFDPAKFIELLQRFATQLPAIIAVIKTILDMLPKKT